jgi:hypothetical protein
MPWLDIRAMDQKIAFISTALVTMRGEFYHICSVLRTGTPQRSVTEAKAET